MTSKIVEKHIRYEDSDIQGIVRKRNLAYNSKGYSIPQTVQMLRELKDTLKSSKCTSNCNPQCHEFEKKRIAELEDEIDAYKVCLNRLLPNMPLNSWERATINEALKKKEVKADGKIQKAEKRKAAGVRSASPQIPQGTDSQNICEQ